MLAFAECRGLGSGTMEILMETDNVDPDKIFEKLTTQKYRKISELLAHLERTDLPPFERAEALNNMRAIIAAIWGSDEIRR
ncbi:hypothetical protein QTG54_000583 [Skeletonema marinoi]|uniref:Uncharacterized protein n=1 Tax=Skeletonema marinoi TaxID=267567 RepID=A0AAD8YL65_9STRA|nr:hypothetical protein QTG54_000583 [Skeletonema marinoi]